MTTLMRACPLWLAASFALAAQGPTPRSAAPPRSDSSVYGAMSYRFIGPPGNRVSAVAGVPGDPSTYYAGAASGGIWKTTDGGAHWHPIFDAQPVASIGALAVAPSDTSIVWAGTGESFIRSHISMGWGIFRSTDAGATWTRMGLEHTGRIARIVIDPRDPNVVTVAALGHAYAPQQERGIYRTADGGATWTRVLFVNDSTGGIDVVPHPTNPDVLYAATWQIAIHTWGRTSGGAGSGIWISRDAGSTWSRVVGRGLPTHVMGKIGLATSRANPDRVYALIETGKGIPFNGAPTDTGTLWRSDDAGGSWRLVNSNPNLLSRPAYYTRMVAEPDNADEAYFLSIFFNSTRDGGATLVNRGEPMSPGFDNHDMWIDPQNGRRMIVGNDEGVSLSVNRGQTWTRIRLPIAQMYRVSTDNRIPYTVCGNMQDGPSSCGPSNSKTSGSGAITGGADIPRGMWYSVSGGESGAATPDPVNRNIVWSTASGRGSVGGIVVRYNVRDRSLRDVEVWPVNTGGHAAKDVKYRFVWDFPIALSPHDHNRIYVGSQFVHMTTNGGQSWSLISPDLTRNDSTKQQHSGGLTGDNIGVEYGDVVYAIAESPLVPGLIWVGTNDGRVHVTRNGGTTWTDVSGNIPQLLPWGTIGNIEPSHYAAGTAYLTVNGHQEGNFDPWVYKTTDYGRSWTLITTGLPHTPLGFARCVREDPFRRGLLYLGTESALYVSFDDGAQWEPLQLNLPHAPVSWLTVQKTFHDLVVGTYGRGFYVLDDVSALEQLTPAVRAQASHLFASRSAYRFRLIEDWIREASDDPTAGKNPPYGASIDYWLASVPSDSVTVTIADSVGRVIRVLNAPRVAGLNRVVWDLRYDPLTPASPPVQPARVAQPPAGAEEGVPGAPPRPANVATNPPPSTGGGVPRSNTLAPPVTILAPPGRYRVTLTAAGASASQPLAVIKDPDSAGSAAEIAAQQRLLKSIATDLRLSNQLDSAIERTRSQLRAFGSAHADSAAAELRASASQLEHRLMLLADSIVQQKPVAFYEWPVKLSQKLSYLAGHVQSSDRQPTDQAREAFVFLHGQLALVRGQYEALLSGDLATFNEQLRRRGITPVLTVTP